MTSIRPADGADTTAAPSPRTGDTGGHDSAARPLDFSTRGLHAGREQARGHGARATPIHLTAGFVFDDLDEAAARFGGEDDGFIYTRMGNPSIAAVERRLSELEGGLETVLTGSGQAATTIALLGILQTGDHLLAANTIYDGSRNLFLQNFTRFGIEVDFVEDPADLAEWRSLLTPNTRALFGETVANPTNEVLDLEALAALAHERGIPLVVDATLSTPYLLRPLEHGADVVVHSASKFLGGHGSVLGGAIVAADTGAGGAFDWASSPGLFPHLSEPDAALGGRSWIEARGAHAYTAFVRDVVGSRFGTTLSPLSAFLLEQGIETLALRVERQSASALAVAEWLAARPEVLRVDYAGLPGHPSHALARRYLPDGVGSVFSVTLHGGLEAARAVHDGLELFTRMTHLGDVRSLVLHPWSTSHTSRDEDGRRLVGITPGTLRFSIGLESVRDLVADLEQALDRVPATARDAQGAGSAQAAPAHPEPIAAPGTGAAPATAELANVRS